MVLQSLHVYIRTPPPVSRIIYYNTQASPKQFMFGKFAGQIRKASTLAPNTPAYSTKVATGAFVWN